MEESQVKQLKINVSNISSFLKDSNDTYIGLKKKNSTLISRQIQRRKQQNKEKRLETRKDPQQNFGLGSVGNKVASTGASIFDKIIGFGSFLLAGVFVNSIPQILRTVTGVINTIVDFVTPIQSAFSLIVGFIQGDFDKKKYDVDKKRVDDSLSQLSGDGGLVDQLAEKTGPLEPIIKALKPAIDLIRGAVGGKKKVLAKQGGKEGVLDTETQEFTERQFTSAERKKYEGGSTAAGLDGDKPVSSPDNKPVGSDVSTPVGPITPGGSLDFVGSGDGASGTLILKDQKGKKLGSWQAISGVLRTADSSQEDRKNVSGVLNPLPDGTYPLMGFGKHGYIGGVGTWSTYINNMTGSIGRRSQILVHNDIGSNGTAGCVGVELGGRSGTDAENKFLKLYEAAKPTSIRVAIGKGAKKLTAQVKPTRSTDNTPVTTARLSSVNKRGRQISSINKPMDDDGDQTIILATQKVIVG